MMTAYSQPPESVRRRKREMYIIANGGGSWVPGASSARDSNVEVDPVSSLFIVIISNFVDCFFRLCFRLCASLRAARRRRLTWGTAALGAWV